MKRSTRLLALPAAALTATLLLAACGSDGDSMDGMDHGAKPAASSATAPATPPASAAPGSPAGSPAGTPAAGFNDADVMFAQMMIPHHEQAVDMAKTVLAKTADPEVRTLATAIEGAQAPEIAQMKGWLTTWGKPAAAGGGHAGMPGMDHGGGDGMMSDADMAAFKAASGKELDRTFLRMMIVHHNGAIAMAQDELAKGVNADARKLAEAVRTSQSAEVAQMQKLLG
ncbi:DUF305 domain-containing protein [Yinghuangia seranimata]|uniref:DUF305 domain-containing protein n=1 Tax=Yinghuangia seranimata TaxID=408067 RepID=UPI00248D06FE|nr:DUF305 domain-containing protein [Yinghuangia seranimata]MDI2126068.1 DUF305 domain-containing protein [Yinghuangia seranimata]